MLVDPNHMFTVRLSNEQRAAIADYFRVYKVTHFIMYYFYDTHPLQKSI
jgi:hypothetical protein